MRTRGPKPKPKPLKQMRNRYERYAKLSEYRFLKLLKGFAELRTPKELSRETGISERTIRDTYWVLRYKMSAAIQMDGTLFGGAGHYLFRFGHPDRQTARFIEIVGESDAFAALVHLQTPGKLEISDEQASVLLMEAVIRVYCKMPGAREKLEDYPDDVKDAYAETAEKLEQLAKSEREGAYGFVTSNQRLDLALTLMKADLLRDQHELGVIIDAHRSYVDPSFKIYSDLRRFLAKHPITKAEREYILS